MKRCAMICLALLACSAMAWAGGGMNVIVAGGGVPAATGFCTSCTGALTFCWEITADDTTITNSGGCSAGDTTLTLQSVADIVANPSGTGYALSIPTTYDSGEFDSASIITEAEGTIQLDVYITTWVDNRHIFQLIGLTNEDELAIKTTGGNDLLISYEGQNGGPVTATAAGNLSLNTWYTVIAKWRQGATDPSLSIEVNGASGTSNTDLTTWANNDTLISFSDSVGAGGTFFYVKNIKMWNAWQ